MSHLFDPLSVRSITLRNRIGVSPMCQYSAEEGVANEWHLVHLGSRAVGGAGLVIAEATAVEARGRISPYDLGLWDDGQVEPLARITRFVSAHGATPAVQLAHAGRKASTAPPWTGGGPVAPADGGWQPAGASPLPFDAGYPTPDELKGAELAGISAAFQKAAERALAPFCEHANRSSLNNRARGHFGHTVPLPPPAVVKDDPTARRAITQRQPPPQDQPSSTKKTFFTAVGLTVVGVIALIGLTIAIYELTR